MTLMEILAHIPYNGKTCGINIDTISDENWLDHALEKLACDRLAADDAFGAGLATAAQSMVVAMTIEKADWSVIRATLEALNGYLK